MRLLRTPNDRFATLPDFDSEQAQRWTDALLSFLRDVCEPYLRIFRRFIPMIGPLDISPIVAILVLQIGGGLIVSAIRG